MRFLKFAMQVFGEVPEGYGADPRLGPRGYVVRFWKVPVQLPNEVLRQDAR